MVVYFKVGRLFFIGESDLNSQIYIIDWNPVSTAPQTISNLYRVGHHVDKR